MDCIGQKPLGALLDEKCEQCADREFIVFEDRDRRHTTITYRLFGAMVNQYAAILHANGIKKGDCVMLVMMNCPEFIAAWFALARIGAVCMPVNVLAGDRELKVIADFTEAAAVITEPRYVALVTGVSQIPRVFVTRTASWYLSRNRVNLRLARSRVEPCTTAISARIWLSAERGWSSSTR